MSGRLKIALVVAGFAFLVAFLAAIFAMRAWDSAEENAGLAETRRVDAEKAKTEAERQQQIALARQLAAQAELTRNQQANLLHRSVLLAVESMKRSPSFEGDQALRHGLALLPRPIARMNHEDDVRFVAFSPDGKYLATASLETARVWKATSGKEVARMNHENYVDSVTFSPDGKYLAMTCADDTARVWEATSGKEVARMNHEEGVESVAFSPDGKYLATASWDDTARVWEATTGKQIARMNHEASLESVAFSPDGKYLATASCDNIARVWEVTGGKEVARMSHEKQVNYVTFSPDGKYLATASGTLLTPSRTLPRSGTARVWEATSGKEVARMNHEDDVWFVAFSPDGKYLATASRDKTASDQRQRSRTFEP
ncbi:MAG: WD40 repeat domain-containing protein [Planctomycetes bacterium]|nr:WD40 repeat domain-containing protein [Planctomycetota bacterium]